MALDNKPSAPVLANTASAPVASAEHNSRSTRVSPRPVSATPRLDALATIGLGLSPKHNKAGMPPQYIPMPLTGAAAMADLQRQREVDQSQHQAKSMISPNPAAQTRAALMGQSPAMMSSPLQYSTLPPRSMDKSPQPPQILGSNAPMTSARREPIMMTMSPQPMEQSPAPRPAVETRSAAMTPIPENPRKRMATSPKLSDRNKSMSYPPRMIDSDNDGRRNPSFPAPDTPGLSRSPSSTRKHKCTHCSQEFTRHHNLKSHLLTHSQEKPYACEECDSKFRRLHDLKRHLKLHTGERSHICDRCGRKFARGDALARHNKGNGGCAGRRGSQGGGEDEDEEGPEDTVMGDDEPQHNRERRQSEPRRDTMMSSPSTYRQYSRTYPPPLARMSSSNETITPGQSMHPPTSITSNRTSREPSYAMSPQSMGGQSMGGHSNYHYGFSAGHGPGPPGTLSSLPPAQGTMFPHQAGMMTESPKPLSPGHIDPLNRATSETSLSTKMYQTQFQPRLPPSGQSANNTLPSLSAISDARYSTGPMQPPASISLHTTQPSMAYHSAASTSGPVSAISSSASHSLSSAGPPPGSSGSLREMYPSATLHETRSSAGSAREVYSAAQHDSAAVEYIRSIERRDQEAQAEISQLRNEVQFLKAQVAQMHAQMQAMQLGR
jgi:DNA-directed RNA polymerase subunit RPC12/RpoP